MGENRWRGYAHPELYKMINEGPGAKASEPQTTYWQNLSKELSEVDTDLNTRLNNLGSRWEGKAAESAQAGLTPLAEWAGDAQTGSSVMRISSEDQAQYVSDARSNMPEPVKVTTPAPSGWQYAAAAVGGIGPALAVASQANDHEEQEAAQNAAEQKAVQTMQTYESSSTWNRDTLGTFVAPPDVVVSTPSPMGHATATIISSTSVNRVNSGDPDGGDTVRTNNNGGPSGTVDTPTVNTGDPGGSNGGGNGGGGNGGGGGAVLPPTVNNPGATNPSDVFVPPVGGGGGGGGGLPIVNPNPLPPSPTPPGQNPFLPPNPFPSFGGGDSQFNNNNGQFTGQNPNNASDIARRAMPLRPGPTGLPGEGGPFGRAGGLGAVDGERVPSQLGRGGVLGGGPGEGVVRSGPGAAGAAGRGGNGVHGPAGAGGRRAEEEEDQEHYAPDYLLEDDDVFGDDRKISPTVIGE